MMSRVFPPIDASDNRTIQSNTNESLLIQEEPNSINTGTETLCSICQRSFESLRELIKRKRKCTDNELTANNINPR